MPPVVPPLLDAPPMLLPASLDAPDSPAALIVVPLEVVPPAPLLLLPPLDARFEPPFEVVSPPPELDPAGPTLAPPTFTPPSPRKALSSPDPQRRLRAESRAIAGTPSARVDVVRGMTAVVVAALRRFRSTK
jgi:hypothetical protein